MFALTSGVIDQHVATKLMTGLAGFQSGRVVFQRDQNVCSHWQWSRYQITKLIKHTFFVNFYLTNELRQNHSAGVQHRRA
ncbi:MAG: hypothetical protein AAFR70_06625 [Pseudomonadota bacterium]